MFYPRSDKCSYDKIVLPYRPIPAFREDSYVVEGFDTETVRGKALLLCSSDMCVVPSGIMDLLDFLWENSKDYNFFWNIRYDVQAIFKWLSSESLRKLEKKKQIQIYPYNVHYTTKFFTLQRGRKRIVFTDLFLIYHSSLERAASVYLHKHKIEYDVGGLTEEDFQDRELWRYCKNDAQLTRLLGEKFLEVVKSEGVLPKSIYSPATISESQIMQRPTYDRIRQAQKRGGKVLEAAYNCYCGGWSQVYKRGMLYGYSYDINSAYPFQMLSLPRLDQVRYLHTKNWVPGGIGFLYARITVPEEDLPFIRIVFKNKTLYPTGTFETWLTSEEFQLIDGKKEILDGWWIIPLSEDDNLQEFVATYYFRKKANKGKDKFKYLYYKTVLNALYGKTIQAIPSHGKVIAGRLFMPIYAAIITSRTRLKLYLSIKELYRQNKLLSISTDSFISEVPVDNIDIGDKIGQWEYEGKGEILILGSGLYEVRGELKRNRQRGFHTNISWIDAIKKGEEIRIGKDVFIRVPHQFLVTLNMAMIHHDYDLSDLNSIVDGFRMLDLNLDGSRLWERRFVSKEDILENHVNSNPVPVEILEGLNYKLDF